MNNKTIISSQKTMSDRVFGILSSIFRWILGIINWSLSGAVPVKLIVCAGCFVIIAVVQPSILLPSSQIWQRLGLKLGPIVNTAVLGLFYFLLGGLMARLQLISLPKLAPGVFTSVK